MNTTRRGLLKAFAIGAGAAALAPMAAQASPAKSFGENEVGMLYDSTKCVGCKACVYSCRKANFDMDDSSSLSPADSKDLRWVNVQDLDYRTKNIIKKYEDSVTKDFAFIKRQCNHCKDPGCVSACPVKAMYKDPVTGIVGYDKSKCIGCRYCQVGCPFNVPRFEWHETFPKITKCELCRETNLRTKDIPACCEVCPTHAVIYGKRSDLLAEAKRRVEGNSMYQRKIYGEKDYGGLNVLTISRVDYEKLGMPNLPDYSYATESETLQHTIYKTVGGVPVAPVILYVGLAAVALTQRRKREKGDNDKGGKS